MGELEFKTTTGTRREAVATACAMLNHKGGLVLFGIDPDGNVVGQHVGERTIEEVSAEIQRIDPPAFPEIERIRLDGTREVIAVHVRPGGSAPYRYRGVAYRRVGNATRTMSTDEYHRILFERMHGERRWENQPADGWSVKDLDVAEIQNMVADAARVGRLDEPGSRDPEDLLRKLGLLHDGALSRAATALFGSEERIESDMPQCLLRVARFRGLDRSRFLDNRQFVGNAFALLSHAERFLRETIPITSRFAPDQFTRIDEPLYPFMAIREAVANAICHHDYAISGGSIGLAVYDDRLEITSAGPLHFGLTPDDLFIPHESKPWNPLISRTFHRRGIIEEWGLGTIKMAELATDAGLPHPEIEERNDCVTVRFRRNLDSMLQRNETHLTEQQYAILRLLRGSERALALREIRSLIGPRANERRLREDLAILRSKKFAELIGHGRGARWKSRRTGPLA